MLCSSALYLESSRGSFPPISTGPSWGWLKGLQGKIFFLSGLGIALELGSRSFFFFFAGFEEGDFGGDFFVFFFPMRSAREVLPAWA